MKPEPSNDGITHLNVYSKARTKLGQWLSNFAQSPIETEDGPFQSIEGYWYWLSISPTNSKRDSLRNLYGPSAKSRGRELRGKDWVNTQDFMEKIKRAITLKMNSNLEMLEAFKKCTLPLKHYYVYQKDGKDKVIEVEQADWILNHLNSFREKVDEEKEINIFESGYFS